jgi:uncharacterized OB-fold protein
MARIPLKEGILSTIDPDDDPRLLAGRCLECRQLHFPATELCPYCSSGRCETITLGRGGVLYAYTAVENAPPGYRGQVPYGIGVVELPEGIRIVTRLTESAVDRLRFEMPMRLVTEELFVNEAGDTIVGWAFAPEATLG